MRGRSAICAWSTWILRQTQGRAYEALAGPAVESLLATLQAVGDGSVVWRPQTGEATYAAKITPADRRLDWRRAARELAAQVRALSPHIGAVTELDGRRTLVWAARALDRPPDEIGSRSSTDVDRRWVA